MKNADVTVCSFKRNSSAPNNPTFICQDGLSSADGLSYDFNENQDISNYSYQANFSSDNQTANFSFFFIHPFNTSEGVQGQRDKILSAGQQVPIFWAYGPYNNSAIQRNLLGNNGTANLDLAFV